MIRALVCDIDSTLADGISWYKITESLGVSVQEHEEIFEAYLAGSITYEESKARLIGLWQSSGNADKAYLTSLFEGWHLRQGAQELIEYARQCGWATALITGSVDLFAEVTARKLSVSHWYANTRLVWNDEGELVDYDYRKDQAGLKLRQLEEFLGTSRIAMEECAVVGDGDNDIAMFTATGNGITVGIADTGLRAVARKQAPSLHEVRRLLKEL